MAPALAAQLGVDARRAVDAAPGGEHAADVAAQLRLRLGQQMPKETRGKFSYTIMAGSLGA